MWAQTHRHFQRVKQISGEKISEKLDDKKIPSRTCLLPNMKYDEKEFETFEQILTDPNATKEQILNSNIDSLYHCKGGLLTISFVVKEFDAIKMYLHWNGQITRLMPKHIKPVLKNLFNMQSNKNTNEIYVRNKEIDYLIGKIQREVYDKYFEAFRTSYRNYININNKSKTNHYSKQV